MTVLAANLFPPFPGAWFSLPDLDKEKESHAFTCYVLMGLFAASFAALMAGIEATYGRYSIGSKAWMMNGKLAWVLQEVPVLIMAGVAYERGDPAAAKSYVNMFLLSMLAAHYVNRTFIFPFRLRGGKPTAVYAMLLAMAFCFTNGYIQARALTAFYVYPAEWAYDPRFIGGVALFFAGVWINTNSDDILRKLRKPGETGYKIPTGGMFEYVSGANFFGEILEWSGFALACWNLPAACFAFCTVMNIGPRAIQHHRWYLKKFGDKYPKHRRAIIPFVY